MDKPILVDTDLEAGKALLSNLEKGRFKVKAAFWFYLSDSNEWRLIFALPLVDRIGPQAAYEKMQSQLQKLDPKYNLALQNISIVSPKENLIMLLKKVIPIGPKSSGIRFTRNTINNVFIEDAYIYRML
jgi:hypothetical protein